MSYLATLKLEGIAGECADAGHKDWIVIDSFNQSLCGPQERGGRTTVSDFAVSKMADRATPQLARATAEGRLFKEAILELCVANGSKAKFMEIRLTQVRVTSFSLSGSPQSDTRTPFENFTLQFEKIEWAYFPNAFAQDLDSAPPECREAISVGYSLGGV